MTSGNPNPWAPSAFASPAAPACQFQILRILLLTILLVSPLKASPYYAWRFYLQESWGEGPTTKTQYIAQVDCRPADCKSIKFVFPKSIANTLKHYQNNFGLCFLHDQTKIVCHKWSGIFGGCPYACVMHKAPKSEMLVIDNQGKVSLTIRDPWHARWEKGTAASSLVAAGIGSGAMGYSVTSAAQLEDKLRVAIEASAASLASLQ
ncbi:Endogenous retrovirus group FC1 Env polyprotein [Plecturocebus cupreus]